MSERDPHDLRNTQHYTNEKGDKLLTSTGLANTRLWLLIAVMTLLTAAVLSAGFMNATAQAQSSRGAITGLTLASDTPGTLTVSWDAASPTPTDYRVDWAKSDEDYQSWKVDDGHKYLAPTINAVTITNLEHDTEYKIACAPATTKASTWANPGADHGPPRSSRWPENQRRRHPRAGQGRTGPKPP